MVLRLLLFALGASMFNFTVVVHWVFGAILLWSGYKVARLGARRRHSSRGRVRLGARAHGFP